MRMPDPELACGLHRAYEADNCPICGTAAVIGTENTENTPED